MTNIVREKAGEEIIITVNRNGEILSFYITPKEETIKKSIRERTKNRHDRH